MEEWRQIKGYPNYEVSDWGNIRNIHKNPPKTLKPFIDRQGYKQVDLSLNCQPKQYRIACLVAAAFLGSRPRGTVLHHKDETKTNDIPINLEYITFKAHNLAHIRVYRGENGSNSKLTALDVFNLKYWVRTELSYLKIAQMFNISPGYLSHLVKGRTWAYL